MTGLYCFYRLFVIHAVLLLCHAVTAAQPLSGLLLLDCSDSSEPQLLSEYQTLDTVNDIEVRDSLAYLAADQYGLRIVDISDPTDPDEIGHQLLPNISDYVSVCDTLAFISVNMYSHRELFLVDVSNPEDPDELGSLDFNSLVYTTVLQDTIAYVAAGQNGLGVCNIADPENPQLICYMEESIHAFDLILRDDLLYLIDFWFSLLIYDVSEPAAPVLISNLENFDIHPRSGILTDDYICMTGELSVFAMINISDPGAPFVYSEIEPIYPCNDVAVSGDRVYLASMSEFYYIVDINDPDNPAVAYYEHLNGETNSVGVCGDIVVLSFDEFDSVTAENSAIDPVHLTLEANYPNPFNSTTRICYTLSHPRSVTLNIYNLSGQLVETVVNGNIPAGRHEINLDCEGWVSGLYLYQLSSAHSTVSRKMLLMK